MPESVGFTATMVSVGGKFGALVHPTSITTASSDKYFIILSGSCSLFSLGYQEVF